jgi:hypothetical protein
LSVALARIAALEHRLVDLEAAFDLLLRNLSTKVLPKIAAYAERPAAIHRELVEPAQLRVEVTPDDVAD